MYVTCSNQEKNYAASLLSQAVQIYGIFLLAQYGNSIPANR